MPGPRAGQKLIGRRRTGIPPCQRSPKRNPRSSAPPARGSRNPVSVRQESLRHLGCRGIEARRDVRRRRARRVQESCVEESVVSSFRFLIPKRPGGIKPPGLFFGPPRSTRATSRKAGKRSNRCARRVRSCRLGRLGASECSIRPLCGMNRTLPHRCRRMTPSGHRSL
jgi:hypothetical protein